MPVQVIMPSLGESVIEGTLTRWLKATGEPVEQHEALVEINTDKVDAEVASPASGVLLAILVPEGQNVQAGAVLGVIGQPGEDPGSAAPSPIPLVERPAQGRPAAVEVPLTAAEEIPPLETGHSAVPARMGRDPDLGFISPLVARIALDRGIDLRQVTGTGLAGRITKNDLLHHLEKQPAPGKVPTAQPTSATLPGDELLPLSPVRRRIAEHMVLSERTSPHVTTVMEADLSRVLAHRQAHKEAFQASGVNLTFTPYFISTAIEGIKAFPIVNASWSDQGILLHRQINFGMAVALEDGLIVPVIRQADSLSLLGLARSVNDLAGRARLRQLTPDEVKGGTFTLTNHGVSGSLFATPIINQPQCAILGVGAIQKRPVVVEMDGQDALVIRPMVYLSLTFDHRLLDGAVADHFLAKVVQSLQTWKDD
jgi:pyruvate/2-oxoglutarate dehydrogenase complex dihydrolipoamide acyltransferase (E2) component